MIILFRLLETRIRIEDTCSVTCLLPSRLQGGCSCTRPTRELLLQQIIAPGSHHSVMDLSASHGSSSCRRSNYQTLVQNIYIRARDGSSDGEVPSLPDADQLQKPLRHRVCLSRAAA